MIVRHSPAQETPVPIYVGLQLHAHTRKRELIDNLCRVGMSISYDRVLRLSTDMGNTVCRMYELENVVCPPTMHGNLFTTAAVDNIDHNPSSTAAKHSFHRTSISLLQHKTSQDDGVVRNSISIEGLSTSKSLHNLPHYYTHVAPVSTGAKDSPVPAGASVSLQRNDCKSHKEEEDRWLRNVHEILSCPPSLSNMGNLRLGGRSDLLPCLQNLSAAKSEAPAVKDSTLDGPAIVQMLKPGISKTFEVYAKEVFLPYISLQLCSFAALQGYSN